MKKNKRKYPLRAQTSPEMNNILLLHSEWLEKEGLKKEPSRALIVIGRIAPSVWGSFASQKTLIAKSA